ncbi:uncharacterized protein LOC129719748 [Wyeomyia smithii]|uniref:uncharacterized protein LOC129719748 n=1 Tax=Wyeomyia smithii TaxID=174621 RepID=UPI002467DC81|nr:uncharacterized protein LOC129719748 [Wyeomyia smithii]
MHCSLMVALCGLLLLLMLLWKVEAGIVCGADTSSGPNNDYEENVSKLIFDFIGKYKRLKFGIIFTCTRQTRFSHGISKLLMKANISLRVVNIDDYGNHDEGNQEDSNGIINNDEYGQLMRSLVAHRQFVILDQECEQANDVLEQASRYELFNASFHWLIIDKKLDSDGSDTPMFLAAAEPERWTRMYRLRAEQAALRCPCWVRQTTDNQQTSSRLQTCARTSHGGNSFEVDYDKKSYAADDSDAFGHFETMNISINAEITLVKPASASYQTFALFDIWNPGFVSGGRLNVTAMGNYSICSRSSEGQLIIRFRESIIVRRQNLMGLKLKIMTVVTQKPHEPFEHYLSTPKDTHLDSVHRYNFGLMGYLKEYFNFSLIMRRTKSWGYLRNGTFDGMIGALARREVDLGGSPMFFRQERHRVVSYTTRSFIERPCFIFRHPRRQNTMRNPFLLPFETVIWYLMTICGAILAVVLFISFYFEDAGTVQAGKSSIHANKFDGRTLSLKIADDESYYEDSFHFKPTGGKRLPFCLGQAPRQRNIKENALFNGTHKHNSSPDRRRHLLLERHQWRKTLSQRHHFNAQHHRTAEAAAAANDENSNIATGKAETMQQTAHFVQVSAAACEAKQDARESDSASSNYKADKLSKSILLFLGGVCQQGLSEIPHLPSGKCTSLFILLFGYLMFQYYSASIVGSLLMAPPRNIKTLRNLIDSRLVLGIEDIPYSRDYFVRTQDEDSLELYRKRISFFNEKTQLNESHYLNAADGLALVKAGGYAFHVAISAGYKIIRETFSELEVCELAEIDMFPRSAQWMVAIVQKNSPYRDVITYGLRRLNEAGIMDHQRHVWQEPKPKCVRKIAPTDLIVGMDSVYSAFILLFAGSLLSAGLLLIEILHHRLRTGFRWNPRRWHRDRQLLRPQPAGHEKLPPQLWNRGHVYPYNVRGLCTKIAQLRLLLSSSDYDVIVLAETWLNPVIDSAEKSSNYTLFRCDRNEATSVHSRGGCVLIAVKSHLSCSSVSLSDCDQLEKTRKCFFLSKSDRDRINLYEVEVAYKALLTSTYVDYIAKIQLSIKQNPKQFWDFIRQQNSNNRIPNIMNLDGVEARTSSTTANLFAAFFENVFSNVSPVQNYNAFAHVPVYDLNLLSI